MVLVELLKGVRVTKLYSSMYGRMVLTQDVPVKDIRYDSRRVTQGDMFVAIKGTAVDGHRFIGEAMDRGASVVVVQDDGAMPDTLFMHLGILKIVVPDSREALAVMADNYFKHPSHGLRLAGVTGTNGKTTTTHLLASIFEAQGMKAGVIGTIAYTIGGKMLPASHTTPESVELNELLAAMVAAGCGAAAMEVSSHALVMHRVHGLKFAVGVFTNLTQDHLDYHGSMEEYFKAKKMLFDALPTDAAAVTNAGDPYGLRVVADTRARIVTYSSHGEADVTARDTEFDVRGMNMKVVHGGKAVPLHTSLTGRFNVENVLAAYAGGLALGFDDEVIVRGLSSLASVRGRLEQIAAPAGWTAVVDYAHTPDALEKCIRTLRELLPPDGRGRIITVFGCGGNRDRGKRPLMGRIASELSDITIVTSDNPRKEDPASIIGEIMAGVISGRDVRQEQDRRAAIRQGIALAGPGDIVLVAGKGHEDYQVIGETRHHFDDRQEIEACMRNMI